jgi:phosphatidylglycerophosphatase A
VTRLAVFLATAAYSGYFPIAPGTVGSAVGLAVYAGLSKVAPATGLAFSLLEVLVIAAVFFVGIWAATVSERHFGGTDPGPIVLDEVLGMLVTLAFIPVGLAAAIAGFFLFRIFDIVKPFPARRFEALHGGLGVMADDAMAGVYANLSLRLLMFVLPGWVV